MKTAAIEALDAASPSIAAATESIAETDDAALPTQDHSELATSRPQLQGTAVLAPFLPKAPSFITEDAELLCKDCKLPVVPEAKGVRKTAKTKPQYQCSNCNSMCTVMNYAMGGWPSDEFKQWDPETKVKFYRSGLKGSDVKRHYAQTCAKKHIERKINRDAGEMRPLQYWVNLGYDAERLKTYTSQEDQTYTDQVGWQFRVNVNTVVGETQVEREAQDILSKMANRTAMKKDYAAAKTAARTLQRKLSKSVSSTSMSSSSSPEKKKKQRRQKKEARHRKEAKENSKDEKLRKRAEEKLEKDLAGTPLGCVRPPRAAFPQNAHKRLHR